jgi:hypothetical protein
MRRIDILIIGLGIFGAGGLIYLLFQVFGVETAQAGIWSQVLLIVGVIIWVLTYLFRVVTHNMTYHQQLKDYEEAVIQKRIEEMTPEEIAQLQAQVYEDHE